MYVDDGLVISERKKAINVVLKELTKAFEITTSEVKYFIGPEIMQNKPDSAIEIR